MSTGDWVLREMLFELRNNRLAVALIPQRDPDNSGACVRVSISHNCCWYQQLCADFESARKRQYRKFKTKVKRREIMRILCRLIENKPCQSMYADWIVEYSAAAKERVEMHQVQQTFEFLEA